MLRRKDFEAFPQKVWLSSPTMHNGTEMEYVLEAYNTNWMSTVGAHINEVEKIAAEKAEVKLCRCFILLHCSTTSLHETCWRETLWQE